MNTFKHAFFCITLVVTNTVCANCKDAYEAKEDGVLDGLYEFVLLNGTTKDLRTGLEWNTCLIGQTTVIEENKSPTNKDGTIGCEGFASNFTWQQALQYAETFNTTNNLVNDDKWRIPNLNELVSIVDYECSGPSAHIHAFPMPTNSTIAIWSSTPHLGIDTDSWAVDFLFGEVKPTNRTARFNVRMVRNNN